MFARAYQNQLPAGSRHSVFQNPKAEIITVGSMLCAYENGSSLWQFNTPHLWNL